MPSQCSYGTAQQSQSFIKVLRPIGRAAWQIDIRLNIRK
jgi:hypothetical protein